MAAVAEEEGAAAFPVAAAAVEPCPHEATAAAREVVVEAECFLPYYYSQP